MPTILELVRRAEQAGGDPIDKYGRQVVKRWGELALEVTRYQGQRNRWAIVRTGPRGGRYPLVGGTCDEIDGWILLLGAARRHLSGEDEVT